MVLLDTSLPTTVLVSCYCILAGEVEKAGQAMMGTTMAA